MQTAYSMTMKVRDYECDLQGIVNNAVYLHYLEHARHEFLLAHNISFSELHKNGFDAVVVRTEIDYRASLKSMDIFTVETKVVLDGRLKVLFEQSIHINNKTIVQAKVFTVILKNGRPIKPDRVLAKLL